MGKLNLLPIETLESNIRNRFPEASIQLDRPRKRSGVWYLDVKRSAHPVNIQWQQGKGFGVTASTRLGYGEGADEVYRDEEAAYGRVVSLLLSGRLKERNIDTLSIAGYMTQICCDTTARQAFHRGYKVEFLRDATGTLDVQNKAGSVTAEQLHESILVAQQMFISDVIDKETWLNRIG